MTEKEVELKFLVPETDFDGISVEVGLMAVAEAMQERPAVERGFAPSPYSALSSAYQVLRTIHCRYLDTIGAELLRYPEDPLEVEPRP